MTIKPKSKTEQEHPLSMLILLIMCSFNYNNDYSQLLCIVQYKLYDDLCYRVGAQ